jgi:hypothetical protein
LDDAAQGEIAFEYLDLTLSLRRCTHHRRLLNDMVAVADAQPRILRIAIA